MYRLLMRWVYKKFDPLISPNLHSRQFGGKRGASSAQATQAFLSDMDDGIPWEAIYAIDVYHAFDSPPKVLISTVLAKMGTPTKLLRLIQTFGATYIRGSPAEVFRTTHGVKQGCPLSCLLFVVVFKISLRFLQLHGIRLVAFVDDISSPIAPSHGLCTASLVQQGLALIGCHLNVTKSESLGLTPLPLTPPSLPEYSPPPSPTQAGDDFWSPSPSRSTQEWAVLTEHQVLKVPYLMHLGHPLPARFNQQQGFRVIADELRVQLADLNAHPIQTLDRVTLVNTVVLPGLLYRCESFPLTHPGINELSQAMERFVFGVSGLPSLLAQKTLYTHRSRGLGMRPFHVLYPTRVLDGLHRNPLLACIRTTGHPPMSLRALFLNAVSLLSPVASSTMTPLSVSWNAKSKLRGAVELASVAGLTAYVVPKPGPLPDCTYTDGSRIGSATSSDSSAVLPDGRIIVCRVPGNSTSYRAELVEVLLGSHFSPPHTRLRVDCKVAIAAATGSKRPIKHSRWVLCTRQSLLSKNQSVEWVEGHTGTCTKKDPTSMPVTDPPSPPPPPDSPKSPWGVIVPGELMEPPQKIWTHDLVVQHTHDNFHSSS